MSAEPSASDEDENRERERERDRSREPLPGQRGGTPPAGHPSRRRALLLGAGIAGGLAVGAAGAYAARALPDSADGPASDGRLGPDTDAAAPLALDETDRSGVDALLRERAAAVLAHDRGRLLATVDPQAEPRFRAAQGALTANLAAVPLAEWRYRLVAVDAFPLPALAQAAAPGQPAERRLAARIELDHRLRGYDTRPLTSTQYLTLVRRSGRWLVSSDSDGAAAGLHGDVQLWDQGAVRVVRGRRSLVLGLRPVPLLRALAEVADAAAPMVERVWGSGASSGGWPGRTVLLAPADLDQFADLLSAEPRAYQSIAAVTTGELGAGTAPADRVIVNPQAYDGLSALGQQVVITHETTHAATRAITEPWTPRWLAEGAADWTAYAATGRSARQIAPELAADIRAGRAPRALPTDAEFASTAPRLPQAYEEAWLACRYVADRWGEPRLRALYRAVASSARHTQSAAVSSALHAELGVSPAEFTSAWRAYVRTAMG